MKQAIVKKGKVVCQEISTPVVQSQRVLIKVVNSCISAGTEIASVNDSGLSLIQKAMEKPARIKQVIDMSRAQGIERVVAKLIGLIGKTIYDKYKDKIIFAISVHSLECWLLPLYYTDNRKAKILHCTKTVDEQLKKNNYKPSHLFEDISFKNRIG